MRKSREEGVLGKQHPLTGLNDGLWKVLPAFQEHLYPNTA